MKLTPQQVGLSLYPPDEADRMLKRLIELLAERGYDVARISKLEEIPYLSVYNDCHKQMLDEFGYGLWG